MSDVSLIPFVCGAGASTAGSEHGPLYCYDHGLTEDLAKAGIPAAWAVNPYLHWNTHAGKHAHENLAPRGSQTRRDIVTWHTKKLAQNVADQIRKGHRVVTIGGDHSMAAGSLAGAQIALEPQATLGLVWVDAHTDLHTYESSESKALHGMPLGTLLGLDQELAVEDARYPVFQPENVIYVGLRSVDAGEVLNAQKLNLPIPSITDLRSSSLLENVRPKIERLKERCDHILLSIDLDGFSHLLAPAVGTPVPEGLLADEILPLLNDLMETHSVPLIDLVEFNPTLPGAAETYQFLADILTGLLSSARKSS